MRCPCCLFHTVFSRVVFNVMENSHLPDLPYQSTIEFLCTLSRASPEFYVHLIQVFLKKKTLWEKDKLLVTSNFSISLSVFYLFCKLYTIFITFDKCRLQTLSVWKSLKFVVWERVNSFPVETKLSTIKQI